MALLLERMTDKPWLFRLGYLADTLSEMNKVSLSLQGKQLTVFVAHNKNRAIQQKLEFWKMCMLFDLNHETISMHLGILIHRFPSICYGMYIANPEIQLQLLQEPRHTLFGCLS